MTLTEFLLARIAEDEAVARAAVLPAFSKWRTLLWNSLNGPRADVVGRTEYPVTMNGACTEPAADHIARHDPARVLAECEAKRALLEWMQAQAACDEHDIDWQTTCSDCVFARNAESYDCAMLRFLALPYADHPDYDEAWRS